MPDTIQGNQKIPDSWYDQLPPHYGEPEFVCDDCGLEKDEDELLMNDGICEQCALLRKEQELYE